MTDERVDPALSGEVWPAAEPATDAVLYGHVALSPGNAVEARSLQTFTLTYTAGRFGIDGSGGIKIVFRFTADWGALQTNDPAAVNYVTAETSTGLPLRLRYAREGHPRPWYQALDVILAHGHLREGDTITVVLGDRCGGSPGIKVQSCCETDFRFMVLADICATGHFVPITESPSLAIVSGAPVTWRAVLPTLRRPGEIFRFGIRSEDLWGNPSDQAMANLRLEPSIPVAGLPDAVDYPAGSRSLSLDGLNVIREGLLRIALRDAGGAVLARSNPLLVRSGKMSGYWADLHGQSGESVGINTARQYFAFARDCAFLDACSHQANDFQVNNAFWRHLNELTAGFHADHQFVTFPGYEWSGNTSVGGDRNVYFRREGRPIRRSSHALLPDRSDIASDANDARALFDALANEDAVVFAHVGGRWADIAYAHDGRLETAVEIHSAWGTFEWLMADALRLGHRVGIVCNSDGHKGRPGASHPGASEFAAYGGLTCLIAEELTRDGIFACLRRRHHYGTTGSRLHMDVRARFPGGARIFERDPKLEDSGPSSAAGEAMMGDIVATDDGVAFLVIEIEAAAPIERIEVRNGLDTVDTLRPFGPDDLGSRVRVVWRGAERRGKGARTRWLGTARFEDASIRRFSPINAWNPELPFGQEDDATVVFESRTAGNLAGFDAWLDAGSEAAVKIETNHGTLAAALSEIGIEDTTVDLGGLDRRLEAFRLPDDNPHRSFRTTLEVPLSIEGDNPIWLCVSTEDGHQAWSSPIYVFRSA
jgi:hypothetical protein